MANVGVHDGRSIDLVFDSPDGDLPQCDDSNPTYGFTNGKHCLVSFNSDGIGSWRVAQPTSVSYKVRAL